MLVKKIYPKKKYNFIDIKNVDTNGNGIKIINNNTMYFNINSKTISIDNVCSDIKISNNIAKFIIINQFETIIFSNPNKHFECCGQLPICIKNVFIGNSLFDQLLYNNYYHNHNQSNYKLFSNIELYWNEKKSKAYVCRNGDLTYRYYINININLPNIQNTQNIQNLNNKINNSLAKIPNELAILYVESNIFDNGILNLPRKLKQLYIISEFFNVLIFGSESESESESESGFESRSKPYPVIPISLELLAITSKNFNQSLSNLPNKLKYLYINSPKFNNNLSGLPQTLVTLSIVSTNFNLSLDNLPNGLCTLHIIVDSIIKLGLLDNLPESIKYLYLYTDHDYSSYNLENLPRGLEEFAINNNIIIKL